ncbi:MAG: hypothetical protein R6V02_04340 [Candidatus Aminicenantes bacterium]
MLIGNFPGKDITAEPNHDHSQINKTMKKAGDCFIQFKGSSSRGINEAVKIL